MSILIFTDGFSIKARFFQTEAEAQAQMAREYNDSIPDDLDEEWQDMSYLTNGDAILYTGDDVFVWSIIQNTPDNAEG